MGQFTGKERDAESALDYFGARYMSSAQGRFTSPDWSASPQAVPYADLSDPQTLSLYSYVRNNPLSKTDPDGHCIPGCIFDAVIYGETHPRATQAVLGAGKLAVGVGLIATVAGGDLPGGAMGTILVANTVMGAATTTVSGTVELAGAAANTDVSDAQRGISAVSNLGAVVTTAATGGNLEAGKAAGTLTSVATLGARPASAFRNAATMAKAGMTVQSAGQGLLSLFRGIVAPKGDAPPSPRPPSVPACNKHEECGR